MITFGQFETNCLNEVSEDITREFLCPVHIQPGRIDLEDYYDQARRQYDGNRLLKLIEQLQYTGNVKKIGLFRVDLHIPILTYIFGQAYYRGNSGIASMYRLRNEQYGMPPDDDQLIDRFRKVIIHELGHTFGLVHCLVPNCVMRSGTYVEDLDQKRHHLCSRCKAKIFPLNKEDLNIL